MFHVPLAVKDLVRLHRQPHRWRHLRRPRLLWQTRMAQSLDGKAPSLVTPFLQAPRLGELPGQLPELQSLQCCLTEARVRAPQMLAQLLPCGVAA